MVSLYISMCVGILVTSATFGEWDETHMDAKNILENSKTLYTDISWKDEAQFQKNFDETCVPWTIANYMVASGL